MNIELYEHVKVNEKTILLIQFRKIQEEVRELEQAIVNKDIDNMFEESFDVMQATFTFLKLICLSKCIQFTEIIKRNKLHMKKMFSRYKK